MRTASGTSIDVKDSILDAVGDTPLVRLSRLGKDLTPQLVAKVEALNPGGSIKDRAAIACRRGGRARQQATAKQSNVSHSKSAHTTSPSLTL